MSLNSCEARWISARDQLARLVAASSSSATSGPASARDVSALISIARQAAENPRHLDYLTALAAHAGDIADTLESGESQMRGFLYRCWRRCGPSWMQLSSDVL